MYNINEPIPYNWKLGWGDEIGSSQPIVNPLLKAIIEKDVNEIDRLFAAGASLKACDQTTFRRVLYHVIDSYPVMCRLVKHGFSRIGHDIDSLGDNGINDQECLTPGGYRWGVIARAYYLGAYDVMDLLASHGFNQFNCYTEGWAESEDMDYIIFKKDDKRAIQILLENSYDIGIGPFYRRCYEKYVINQPQVRRKSIGLEDNIFRKTPQMRSLEKVPLIFGRKEVIYRNNRRREDYEDRVRAFEEFKAAYGVEEYAQQESKERKLSAETGEAMIELLSILSQKEEAPRSYGDSSVRSYDADDEYTPIEEDTNPEPTFSEMYEAEREDIMQREFGFVDCSGAYRRWGDSFVDTEGNWCRWGDGFYDYDGNYIRWGETYKDSSGAYRRWGDDFVDCEGNWVKVP